MSLDFWSITFSLLVSCFAFLIFILSSKKQELYLKNNKILPASKEVQELLTKNFLGNGQIPTKSEIILLMSTVSRKHDIHLLSHLPVQDIIDQMIYHVISNDLLSSGRKKEITASLTKLKVEPIDSKDYIHLVAEAEESDSWRQKWSYSYLIKSLMINSLILAALWVAVSYIDSTELASLPLIGLLGLSLIMMIGLTSLIGGYATFAILRDFTSNSASGRNQKQRNAWLDEMNRAQIQIEQQAKALAPTTNKQKTEQQQSTSTPPASPARSDDNKQMLAIEKLNQKKSPVASSQKFSQADPFDGF